MYWAYRATKRRYSPEPPGPLFTDDEWLSIIFGAIAMLSVVYIVYIWAIALFPPDTLQEVLIKECVSSQQYNECEKIVGVIMGDEDIKKVANICIKGQHSDTKKACLEGVFNIAVDLHGD